MRVSYRFCCITSLLFIFMFAVVLFAAETSGVIINSGTVEGDIKWVDIRDLDVEGKGWQDTKAFYDRLPAKAEGVVREPVWKLSHHSAGMCVRFVTDADSMKARWSLLNENLAMPHMPATGVSGLDLYVKTENGKWHWLKCPRPTKYPTNTATLFKDLPVKEREYLLYLPLYNGVTSVEIGIPADKIIRKAPPRDNGHEKPIVFYGTSITQGGCASRPGMAATAIIGRRMGYPVINLGFSGNGRMEFEMAQLLAELDPCVYVLDCLPNMTASKVAERLEPLVRLLRQNHPVVPIVLVEDRSYENGFMVSSSRKRNLESRAALRHAYENLITSGVKNLFYIYGENQLGRDGEGTVDGSHPTDLGFWRQANVFQNVLESVFSDYPGEE